MPAGLSYVESAPVLFQFIRGTSPVTSHGAKTSSGATSDTNFNPMAYGKAGGVLLASVAACPRVGAAHERPGTVPN